MPLQFFTDQNVADSAGNALIAAGHEVVRLRDCLATDAKDGLVALTCLLNGFILVSHDTDFRAIAKRLDATRAQHQKRFHRIDLRCVEPLAASRLTSAIGLIQNEWEIATTSGAQLVIEIRKASILTHR